MTSTPTMTIGELADVSALDRLAVVQLAKSAGFDLDETVRLFDAVDADPDAIPAEPAVWAELAEFKLAEIDALAARLESMRSLLNDTLALGYLPADRMHRVPSALGWTAPHEHEDHGLSVPADAAGLAQDTNHQD
jgi:hypothetical protein